MKYTNYARVNVVKQTCICFVETLPLQFFWNKLTSVIVDNLARESGGGMYLKANNTMIAYDSSLASKFVAI